MTKLCSGLLATTIRCGERLPIQCGAAITLMKAILQQQGQHMVIEVCNLIRRSFSRHQYAVPAPGGSAATLQDERCGARQSAAGPWVGHRVSYPVG